MFENMSSSHNRYSRNGKEFQCRGQKLSVNEEGGRGWTLNSDTKEQKNIPLTIFLSQNLV